MAWMCYECYSSSLVQSIACLLCHYSVIRHVLKAGLVRRRLVFREKRIICLTCLTELQALRDRDNVSAAVVLASYMHGTVCSPLTHTHMHGRRQAARSVQLLQPHPVVIYALLCPPLHPARWSFIRGDNIPWFHRFVSDKD